LNDSQLHIWRALRRKKQPGLFFRAMILLALPLRKGEVRSRDTKMIPLNVPYSALKGRALFSLIFSPHRDYWQRLIAPIKQRKPLTRP
jgi:iron complex outermembrane receptor protein